MKAEVRPDWILRFWSKVRVGNNCWDWIASAKAPNSYGQFNRKKVLGKSLIQNAHKVAYEMLRGPTGGLHVLHRCNNRKCVRPSHLYLGTELQNAQDKMRDGKHWRKFSPGIIAYIRQKVLAGTRMSIMAREVGMSYTMMKDVISRRSRAVQ